MKKKIPTKTAIIPRIDTRVTYIFIEESQNSPADDIPYSKQTSTDQSTAQSTKAFHGWPSPPVLYNAPNAG